MSSEPYSPHLDFVLLERRLENRLPKPLRGWAQVPPRRAVLLRQVGQQHAAHSLKVYARILGLKDVYGEVRW